MNGRDFEVRPLFRVLAGIFAISGWATLGMFAIHGLVGDRPFWLRWMGYVGITGFSFMMTRTAFLKK